MTIMDNTDRRLITALRRDGRASISALAQGLKLSRATVKTRIERLIAAGEIVGFTAVLKGDAEHAPVRGLMMIAIEGRSMERAARLLAAMPEVEALHTTNGKWDLICEIGAASLEELDAILRRIRLVEGISQSETNLLLATRKLARAVQ